MLRITVDKKHSRLILPYSVKKKQFNPNPKNKSGMVRRKLLQHANCWCTCKLNSKSFLRFTFVAVFILFQNYTTFSQSDKQVNVLIIMTDQTRIY